MYRQRVKQAIDEFIAEAIEEYGLAASETARDAISQAVYRTLGYVEAAVVREAEGRMEKSRAAELRQIVHLDKEWRRSENN